jgi:hypothetical protein
MTGKKGRRGQEKVKKEREREKEGGRRDITMADRRLRNNISRQRGKRKKEYT